MRPEIQIHHILLKTKKTLSLAESCTGGLVTHRLTNVPGSSLYLRGSIIAYHNDIKTNLLTVPAGILKKQGAVSQAVAERMAQHVRRIFKTDYGLSLTGIAGPGGGTIDKPVGLVFISVATPTTLITQKYLFQGTRLKIKQQSADRALVLLKSTLDKHG